MLVNENLDILQYRGDTGPYLAPAPGEPSHSLLKMARQGLFLEIRAAVHECQQTAVPAYRRGVRVRGESVDREIDLHVLPVKLPHSGERGYLVLFEENVRGPVPLRQEARPEPAEGTDAAEVSRLRQELDSTREYLQHVIEQQDAANEELKSANEEILSSNEELQSTNEELETAKEEMQSVNEELTTVNEQLQSRNAEMGRLNDNLNNLLASNGVPNVVLGVDLRIRRFTPAAAKLFDLLPSDVGRPIGQLKPAVEIPDLEALVAEVIETVRVKEQEVQDNEGRWYALRIHPYRTADNRIDGAVLVLFDITERQHAEEALEEADRRKDEFLAMLAHELRNPLAPIRNALEVMRLKGPADPQLQWTRDVIDRQVQQQTHLVDDLLDLSRISRGKISLQLKPIDLATVVAQAVEISRPLIDARKHHLEVSLPEQAVWVEGDLTRLTQVVSNLLNNAAKYTEQGGSIWLAAEASR